jgi:hypothetical protein
MQVSDYQIVAPDETKDAQSSLKIRIPTKVGIRDHIIWKPILTETIQVFFRSNSSDEFKSEIQPNRKINRNVLEEKMDLDEFVWNNITLPEGENSCLPVIYDQEVVIPEADETSLTWYRYSLQKISEIAHKIMDIKSQQQDSEPAQTLEQPKFNANNHLILKLFNLAEIAEKNYNKYQYPVYPSSEKERNNIDFERHEWFKVGLFEDAKRLFQVFDQFPIKDQVLFDDYKEICQKLFDVKEITQDKQTKSMKLAYFYEMILIATKNLPNKISFVEEETESPDFGKLLEKD